MKNIKKCLLVVTSFVMLVGSLAFSTPASVKGASVSAVDADSPALQPFQQDAVLTLPDGFSGSCPILATVPAGKRLVIEYVTARATVPGGQKLRMFQLKIFQNGDSAYHHLAANETGIFNEWIAAQQVRLYADPSTPVDLCIYRSGWAGNLQVSASVSGYLVDIP
jgi:hypothetical protein